MSLHNRSPQPTAPAATLAAPCSRYQQYLESVLEVADEYQEVSDLLLRHATLSATNADLKDHQRRCSELAEKVRTELQIYVKQKTDEILNLNNQVGQAGAGGPAGGCVIELTGRGRVVAWLYRWAWAALFATCLDEGSWVPYPGKP